MKQQLHQLIVHIEYTFHIQFLQPHLLKQAFTHSSYANEKKLPKLSNNERLEFLGDAVLELAVSQYLYDLYPDLPEGKLTKMRAAIVCEESLAKFAKACQFDQYVFLGKGEELSNGRNRTSLLCDLFEAFLGALYLDQGEEAVQLFLRQTIYPKIESGYFLKERDYKTLLQEYLQQQKDVKIKYHLVDEQGPAHDRQFFVEVSVNDVIIGKGAGKSKKNAEQAAAREALLQAQEQ